MKFLIFVLFSMDNKTENLMKLINKIVEESLEKKTGKPLQILLLQEYNGNYRIYNCIRSNMVDNFFSVLPIGIQSINKLLMRNRELILGIKIKIAKNF